MNEPILAPVGRCRGRGRKLSTNIEPIGRGRGRPLLFEKSVLDISVGLWGRITVGSVFLQFEIISILDNSVEL